MTYDSIVSDINKGKINNLYLLFGAENFFIRDVLSRIEEKVINPAFRSLNYIKFDGSSVTYDTMVNACETLPFMDEKRMVVIADCFFFKSKKSKKDEALGEEQPEDLCQYFSHIPENTILVLTAGDDVDKRKKVFNSVKKSGCAVEFGPIKGQELLRWIGTEFKKHGKTIGRSESQYLADMVASNLENMENEIAKLCSYVGSNGSISKSDIEAVVSKSFEMNIFQLVDSISSKNPGQALLILNELLLDFEPAAVIMSMITRQFRLILNAKLLVKKGYSSAEVASKLGTMPFVASNMIRVSNNYSEEQIEKKLKRCLYTDIAIKTGKIEQRTGIELLIVELGQN